MAIHLMPTSEHTPPLRLHRRGETTYGIRRLVDGAWWSMHLEQWVPDRELATSFQFYTVAALLGSIRLDGSLTLWEVVPLSGDRA